MKGETIGIQIGASAVAVQASHKAIMDILRANRDREVTLAALAALWTICGVSGTMVSNTTVNQGGSR